MEENQNLTPSEEPSNQTPSNEPVPEQLQEAAFQPPQGTTDGPAPQSYDYGSGEALTPAPKKGNTGLCVLIGVIVVAIVVLAVVLLGGGDPEENVRAAMEKSQNQAIALQEKMTAELPAMKRMYPVTSEGITKSDISFTLQSIDDGSGDLEISFLSNLFKGSGLNATVYSDLAQSASQFTGDFQLAGMQLISFAGDVSPTRLAVGIPNISDTIFSFNLPTLADDYKASALYAGDETMYNELKTIQEALVSQMGSGSIYQLDVNKLNDDMMKIMDTAMNSATYEKPVKTDGGKLYTVKLSGDQVRQTVIDLAQYIYVDSEIGKMYDKMIPAIDGQTFTQIMQTEIVQVLKDELPAMPMTMEVLVDGSKKMSSLKLTLDAPVAIGEDGTIDTMDVLYLIAPDGNCDMTVNIAFSAMGETANVAVNVKTNYANDVYDVNMHMDMNITDTPLINMDMNMSADKTGRLDVLCTLKSDEIFNLSVDAKGGVTEQENAYTWEYPNILVSTAADGLEFNIGLSSKVATSKVDAMPALAEAKELFKLSEQELQAEVVKLYTGAMELSNKFSSLFEDGEDLYGGTPEASLEGPVAELDVLPEDAPENVDLPISSAPTTVPAA